MTGIVGLSRSSALPGGLPGRGDQRACEQDVTVARHAGAPGDARGAGNATWFVNRGKRHNLTRKVSGYLIGTWLFVPVLTDRMTFEGCP